MQVNTEAPVRVVFTGPALDAAGRPVLRENLKRLAERQGYQVQASIQATTETLVASRDDTVKARKAALAGIKVVDYATFIHRLGGYVPVETTERNVMVDAKYGRPLKQLALNLVTDNEDLI